MFSSLKAKLQTHSFVDLIWLALGSVPLAEFAAHAQPGAIVLDLQHGLWERGGVEGAIAAIGQRLPVIARTADGSAHMIAQALDAGASSVLIPLVETADDARRAVAASRYPPVGTRSAGGVRPLLAGVAAMIEADRQVAVGVLVETVQGVENIQEIVDVPGVDYVFIGTGDLSLSRGTSDPDVIGHDCKRVLQAARARGLPCGVFTGNVEAARQARENGFNLAVAVNDIDMVKQSFKVGREALCNPQSTSC